MLSELSLPYIHASVPVLREHGEAITRHFYASMFADHPELVPMFDAGRRTDGRQSRALAGALLSYASNIDKLETLTPLIQQVAAKHAELRVQPDHYPVVAKYLLGALQHVLGDGATPDLLKAWDEAYWLLADQLIAAESRIYSGQPNAVRGS